MKKKLMREVLAVVRETAAPYGVTAELDHSKPGHPHVLLAQGARYIGTITVASSPAVADDELNYARQRTKRKLREAGITL